MKKLQFGVSSLNLGKPCVTPPSSHIIPEEWEEAVQLSDFYRAGGNPIAASETRCSILWDWQNIYAWFSCQEGDTGEKKEEFSRKDRVELVISSGTYGIRDFAAFGVTREGESCGEEQKGMTYIGGDTAYKAGFSGRIENQAYITQIDSRKFITAVEKEDGQWQAYFAIPWQLVGGVPEEKFGLQVYRKKHQTSEITCPYPQDMNINFSDRFEYDPLTFLEVYLNGTPGVTREDNVLMKLPSGILRWQRPAYLVWPDEEEREAIRKLQEDKTPTVNNNIKERVWLAQRWQDTLTIEGVDFFFGQAVSKPWENREPWVERRLFNEALFKKENQKAYERLDKYLDFLRKLTDWWYVDHSLGDGKEEEWISFNCLSAVEKISDQEVGLGFETSEGQCQIVCSVVGGGFRFRSGGKGFFDCDSEPIFCKEADQVERKKADYVIGMENRKLYVKMGDDWSVSTEKGKPIFQKESLHFRKEEEGFAWCMPLQDSDEVYGFGERFDSLNQRGKVVSLWQRDACEGCLASIGNQSYKNIPLLHNSSGYSIFINSHYRIRADVGNEKKDIMRLTGLDPVLDIFYWPVQPLEAMDYYSQLTGRPLLPPKWVFEPWAGGGGGRWKNGPLKNLCQEQMAVLEHFEELDIPHSGFYAEGAGAGWFGDEKIEELYKIVAFAEKKGIHVFSWQNPDMTLEKAAEFLNDTEDLPVTKLCEYEGETELPRYIDFTHPRGMELLKAQWMVRLDAGIRGTMVDFGDYLPDEAIFYDGRRGKEMHNGYAYEYAKGYRRMFEEKYGDDHVLYTRGAGAGSQAFACQFGGDHLTSFLGMEYAIAGGLTAGASGLPFWGVDAGGYDGFADEETYIRWTEYACFCPIMRYHGTQPREPWEYSEKTVGIYKKYTWLRENLLNYSYHAAILSHKSGVPMMRPLIMEYPEELELARCSDSYLYGPDLLVAPVHQEGCTRTVVFPSGTWVSFWNNQERIVGPCKKEEIVPMERIPVYFREGALIPMELNGSLTVGMSMTTSRKQVLMIAVPDHKRIGKWYRSDTQENSYCMERFENKFVLESEGTEEFSYCIVKGIPGMVKQISINGRKIEKSPSQMGLYFTEEWILQKDNTLLIRILNHHNLELQVEWEDK